MAVTIPLEAHEIAHRVTRCDHCGQHTRVEVDVAFVHGHTLRVMEHRSGSECLTCGASS